MKTEPKADMIVGTDKSAAFTVVVLVDHDYRYTYVGLIQGRVSEDDRAALAKKFDSTYKPTQEEMEDERLREMTFVETDAVPNADALEDLNNIDDQDDMSSAD